jgi:hypothetical protein
MLRLLTLAGALMSIQAAKISGATPSFLVGDLVSPQNLTVHGTGFSRTRASDVITCHVRGGLNAGLPRPNEVPGYVLSDSAVVCALFPYNISQHFIIEVWKNHHSIFSEGTNASFQYRNLIEATPTRRPFLSGEDKELIVWADVDSILAFDHETTEMVVCRSCDGNRHCSNVPVAKGMAAVKVPLGFEPKSDDTSVLIDITLLPSNVSLATKKRRLLTTSAPSSGSLVRVDHSRRSILVNELPFLSMGYYFHSFTNVFRGFVTKEKALEDLVSLASMGTNHVMMVRLQYSPKHRRSCLQLAFLTVPTLSKCIVHTLLAHTVLE